MNRERIGLYFGCFIPLHTGHLAAIQKASCENDRVLLGVCGYDTDRGQNFIPFKERIKLIRKKYRNEDSIIVTEIDDHKIGLTGTFSIDAWKIWCKEYFKVYFDPFDDSKEYTWYMGEQSYIDKIRTIYPHHNFVLLDRSDIQISGTMIRENPNQYRHMIDESFLQYLCQRNIVN